MNLRWVAVVSLVTAVSAFQGMRVTKLQNDRRVFDRAVHVVKVYRFGPQRQSRFDNWAHEHNLSATLSWRRLPRAWFQSTVPLTLTIRIDDRILETFNLLVDLEEKAITSADRSTQPKLDELRRWARRADNSGSLEF